MVMVPTGQHAAEHRTLHEASDRRQGAECVKCCSDVVTGRRITSLHSLPFSHHSVPVIIYLLLNRTQGTSKKDTNTDTKKKQK